MAAANDNIVLQVKRRNLRLKCDECGVLLVKSPSGRVCPNGHGRIQPPMRQSWINRMLRWEWFESLPVAERQKRSTYKIKGQRGFWRIVEFSPHAERRRHFVPTHGKPPKGGKRVVASLPYSGPLGSRIIVKMFERIGPKK